MSNDSAATQPGSPQGSSNAEGLSALARQVWRTGRKLVVLVVGSTVLLIGVIMIVTPGPAVVVIPAGLAILATEFVWAARLLHRVRDQVKNAVQNVAGTGGQAPADAPEDASVPWYRRVWPGRRRSA